MVIGMFFVTMGNIMAKNGCIKAPKKSREVAECTICRKRICGKEYQQDYLTLFLFAFFP